MLNNLLIFFIDFLSGNIVASYTDLSMLTFNLVCLTRQQNCYRYCVCENGAELGLESVNTLNLGLDPGRM